MSDNTDMVAVAADLASQLQILGERLTDLETTVGRLADLQSKAELRLTLVEQNWE